MRETFQHSKWWVFSTAFIMSLNGGYINSVTLISILKNSVGYVTGNLTLAGDAIEHQHYLLFTHLFLLVLCFLCGNIISGLVIKGQNFSLDRRYTTSFIIQFILVSLAMVMLLHLNRNASYLLALAMGIQNAMTTHYGSALIRTTHMTGTTTDLGIVIGHWLKGETIEHWKIILYSHLIFGFLCGTILGAISYSNIHAWALTWPLITYVLMLLLQTHFKTTN